MPWSDWITPDPTVVTGGASPVVLNRYARAEFATLVDVNAEVQNLLGTLAAGGGLDQQGSGEQFVYGDRADPSSIPRNVVQAGITQTLYAVEVGSDVSTRREWFPSMLDGLEYGVDYDVRPDRTGSEDDAYVEYESDGPNTLLGWRPWAMRFEHSILADGTLNASPPDPPSIPIRFGIRAEPLADTSWQPYGVGDELFTLASFPGGPAGGYTNVGAQDVDVTLPVPVDCLQLTLAAQPATMAGAAPTLTVADPPPLAGQASVSQLAQTVTLTSAPSYAYQMPRWRYWIPGDVSYPIRQKQRNDGLGRGVVRARSTSSVQGSIRQRSYR